MAAMNCPKCGRLFNRVQARVCPACEKLEEEQFQQLRKYIEEEPFANITELADATGVPTKRILRYIREGRLEMSQGLMGELKCSQCGEPIEEGNFCSSCSQKMAANLASSLGVAPPPSAKAPEPEKKKGAGFHVRRS